LGGHFPILKFDLRGRILGRFPHQACLVFESCLTKNVTDIIVNERRPAGHNWTEESCYLYLPCMYFPHTHALSPLFCHLRFLFVIAFSFPGFELYFTLRLIDLCVFGFIQISYACFVLFFSAFFLHLLEKGGFYGLVRQWMIDSCFLYFEFFGGFRYLIFLNTEKSM